MILNFEMNAGDTQITSFGGGIVTVSVPFVLPEGVKASDVRVAYIDAEGNPLEALLWTAEDSEIVSVDNEGVVTAKKTGGG